MGCLGSFYALPVWRSAEVPHIIDTSQDEWKERNAVGRQDDVSLSVRRKLATPWGSIRGSRTSPPHVTAPSSASAAQNSAIVPHVPQNGELRNKMAVSVPRRRQSDRLAMGSAVDGGL